jgi:hypothetical protein
MAYALGAVKPHVKTAGEQLGARFGIRTIYGWAPGKYDHPKGLALDFMITNIDNGRAVGDALAAYVVANAASLGVTYVIWYRRIWSVARAGEGWRPYSGDSDHTDHVHVSFAPTGGSGMPLLDIQQTGLSNPIDNFTDSLGKMADMLAPLTRKEMWYRIGMVVGAAILILMALGKMTGTTQAVVNGVKKVSGR